MNYEEDVKIDESALDIEWLNQGEIALKYSRHFVSCKMRFTRAEEHLKLIRSKLINKAYKYPEKFLGKNVKATAQTVEAFYRAHPDHIKAKERWLNAMEDMEYADVGRWEIVNTRKQSLENLVALHGQSYFAGPSIPRNLTDERKRKMAQLNKNIANTINHKTTRRRTH